MNVAQTQTAQITGDRSLAPAPTRRQSLVEVGVASIAALISTTLVGLLWPVTINTGPFQLGTVPPGTDIDTLVAATDPSQVMLPVFLLGFLGPLVVAGALAVVLIEGRRPWPFGRRAQRPSEGNWEVFPAIVAGFLAQETVRHRSEKATSLFVEDGGYLWIGIPASVAAGLVVWLAVFSTTYVIAHAIHTLYLRRTRVIVSSSDQQGRAA